MNDIDPKLNKSFSSDSGFLLNLFKDSTNNLTNKTMKLLSEINQSFQNVELITTLKKIKKGIIDIVINTKRSKENKLNNVDSATMKMKEFYENMGKIVDNLSLRGSINENGSIQSF